MNIRILLLLNLLICCIFTCSPAVERYDFWDKTHELAKTSLTRPQKFVSFDGGGIRGLYSLIIVKAIEDKLEQPITSYCNLFTGTSTGGLIAMGYACGKKTDDLISFYKNHGKDIFYRTYFDMGKTLFGLTGEKYETKPLEEQLIDFFGKTTTLRDLKIADVIIPSTDITKDTSKFYNSLLAKLYDKDDELLWKVGRCTSAAPTYFQPMEMHGDAMVDGGLIANNPSLLAGMEVESVFGHGYSNNFSVVSIGTGKYDRGITYEKAKSMGIIEWASPISGTIMDSSSNMFDYLAAIHYGKDKYVRLNGQLDQDIPLDGVSPAQLQTIEEAAEKYIKQHPEAIEKAARLLRN